MRSVPPFLGLGSAEARRPTSALATGVAPTAGAAWAGGEVGAVTGTGTVGRTAGSAVGAAVGGPAGAEGAGAAWPQAARKTPMVELAKPSPARRRANWRRVSLPDCNASKRATLRGSNGIGDSPPRMALLRLAHSLCSRSNATTPPAGPVRNAASRLAAATRLHFRVSHKVKRVFRQVAAQRRSANRQTSAHDRMGEALTRK